MSAHLGIFSMSDARGLAQRRLPRMILIISTARPAMKKRRI